MQLVPAIDLRGGQCVRLLQGRFDAETVYGSDPGTILGRYRNLGARYVHVVDLDGARADAAEMKIGRGSAGASVEHEGDGPLGILRVARIGDVEHVRRRLAAGAGEGKRAGFRRVVEGHA